MLDWINKENINAKDYASTYKGESVMYEGIATYKDESVFLSKDTLKKCMPNLKGRPVIIEHKLGIKPDNMEKYAVGYVTDCEYNNETGDFDCDFVTWNDEAKELLKNGYTLSTSYIPKEFGNGGTFINTPYDKEIKDLSFTHLAIVKNPRYEKVKVYMNSTEKLNDKWITKFDKDGEPYHVNIDPSDDFKKGEKHDEEKAEPKKEVKEEKKETPQKTDLQEKEDKYNEILKRFKENDRLRWSTKDSDEYHRAYSEAEKAKKELTTARREYAEAIMDNFEKVAENPYDEKLETKRGYYAQKSKDLLKQSDKLLEQHDRNRLPFGQPVVNPKVASIYKKQGQLLDRALDEYDKSKYYAKKSEKVGTSGVSSDDKNAIARLAEKYKNTSSSAERRRIIDRVLDLHRKSNMPAEKKKQETNLGFSIERNTDINRLQLKFGGKPDENTRSILKSSGFRWSPRENAWQRQLTGNAEWALRRVIDKMEKSKPENQNDINEEKENYCMDKIEVEQGFLKSLLDRVSKTLEFSNADDEEEILAAEKTAKETEEKAKAEEEAKKKAEEEAKAKEEAEKAAKEKENSVDWFEKMQEVMNSNDRGEADKIKPAPNAKSALEKGKKIFG